MAPLSTSVMDGIGTWFATNARPGQQVGLCKWTCCTCNKMAQPIARLSHLPELTSIHGGNDDLKPDIHYAFLERYNCTLQYNQMISC